MTTLSSEELVRYSRHFNLKNVGVNGQEKLKAASVLLVGAGGLGSPLALYLTAAGVGRIGIVDFDVVDRTNLQRQILHGESWVDQPKLASAKSRLTDLNPHIQLDLYEERLTSENALEIIGQYDIVADGADNFPTRYLVNDACVLSGKPLVSGSIQGFEGQLSVFNYQGGPCYRCLFPSPPPPGSVPSCAEGGVFGVLPGVIGSLQATEVLKLILGVGEPAAGRLVMYDGLALSFNSLLLGKDPACPVCGPNATQTELIDYQQFCGFTPAAPEAAVAEISVSAYEQRRHVYHLIDVREDYERLISRIDPDQHVPLKQLEDDAPDLPKDKPLLLYCRTGGRSARAARLLTSRGYDATSLTGGINAWVTEIDTSMSIY